MIQAMDSYDNFTPPKKKWYSVLFEPIGWTTSSPLDLKTYSQNKESTSKEKYQILINQTKISQLESWIASIIIWWLEPSYSYIRATIEYKSPINYTLKPEYSFYKTDPTRDCVVLEKSLDSYTQYCKAIDYVTTSNISYTYINWYNNYNKDESIYVPPVYYPGIRCELDKSWELYYTLKEYYNLVKKQEDIYLQKEEEFYSKKLKELLKIKPLDKDLKDSIKQSEDLIKEANELHKKAKKIQDNALKNFDTYMNNIK